MGIHEAGLTRGLYTRLVLHDFLPQYPGRTTFVPGLSGYGATKSWTIFPMAALQRAIIMMEKLNLVGVPRDIVLDLRALKRGPFYTFWATIPSVSAERRMERMHNAQTV